jgi:aspartate racemase
MGPLATVDLMTKIIMHTHAERDQDHIHVIADNYSKIPDRTEAILKSGQNPAPYLIQSARHLQEMGASILVMACNTAHYFFNNVQEAVHVPMIHMPLETCRYISKEKIRNIGLMATSGTLNAGIYQNIFNQFAIHVLQPDTSLQNDVMAGIYSVKKNQLNTGYQYLSKVAARLIADGAEAIVAACTEIPIVLKSTPKIAVIDPTEILAESIVKTVKSDSVIKAT